MIYLDHAATSWPKPRRVISEMTRCLREWGGNPGRGSHRLSMAAAEKLYECREELASFLGSGHPEGVILAPNATVALNLALKGLLQAGDHVLCSDLEHNAVLRPLARLERDGVITVDRFPSLANHKNATAEEICRGIEERIRPNTRMVVCLHASNVCSAVLPAKQIGALCRRRGLLFLLDASQTAGRLPIRMNEMMADAVCLPGHKGLLGPQGSGALVLRKGLTPDPLLEGGSGVDSLSPAMPEALPERLEAGTAATPAAVGLTEGVRFVRELGLDRIREVEELRIGELKERLEALPGITLQAPHHNGAVLSFWCDGISSELLGAELDRRGICVRAGLHCAPAAHQTLGSPLGGTVRVSVGYATKRADCDALWRAMKEILLI